MSSRNNDTKFQFQIINDNNTLPETNIRVVKSIEYLKEATKKDLHTLKMYLFFIN